MRYKYLLWDLDGTLMDFLAAEKAAMQVLFRKYGFGECTDELIERYSEINQRYWRALERNEMTKPQILVGRFREFFTQEGLDASLAEAYNADYQLALGDTIVYCDNSLEYLQSKKQAGYIQAVVTNGTKTAQIKKLSRSGFDQVFDYTFISEDLGVEKPNREFFDHVIAQMGIEDLGQAIVIGDSPTSDILGGNNAGIDTCWYNPRGQVNTSTAAATYEIKQLQELESII